MTPADLTFRRRFACNFYKNLRLPLGEMSLFKNFVGISTGDPYPIVAKDGDVKETVGGGTYRFASESDGASVSRLLGAYLPFMTYEIDVRDLRGAVGIRVDAPNGSFSFLIFDTGAGMSVKLTDPLGESTLDLPEESASGKTLLLTMCSASFDLYVRNEEGIRFLGALRSKSFEAITLPENYPFAKASLTVLGEGSLCGVRFGYDCGIGQADIRPIRYENGDALAENGKAFFTVSLRTQEQSVQAILSWVPGTADFSLTGILYFDLGDGILANDLAASLLYDRRTKEWLLWFCAFSHGHVAAHAKFSGDPRYGVNIIDATLLTPGENYPLADEVREEEDPDFIFDEESGSWLLALCRVDESRKFRYYFYRSEEGPFSGFYPIGHATSGEETGGSFVRLGGELSFVCGNAFGKRADYRVYRFERSDTPCPLCQNPSKNEYSPVLLDRSLSADYDDGGFRGWGSVFPMRLGSRERIFWLTFDRHNGSPTYRWSYGTLYLFEA